MHSAPSFKSRALIVPCHDGQKFPGKWRSSSATTEFPDYLPSNALFCNDAWCKRKGSNQKCTVSVRFRSIAVIRTNSAKYSKPYAAGWCNSCWFWTHDKQCWLEPGHCASQNISCPHYCFIAGNSTAFSVVAEVQEQPTPRFSPFLCEAVPMMIALSLKLCAQFCGRNSWNDQLCYLRILEILISGWSLCAITAIEMCVTWGMIQHGVRSSEWNFSSTSMKVWCVCSS